MIGKLSGGSFFGARSKYASRSGDNRAELVMIRTPVLVPGACPSGQYKRSESDIKSLVR